MNLDNSERSKELGMRISQFMDEHIFPAESIYADQMEENSKQGNRWQIPQIIEDKKKIAKKDGLWNIQLEEIEVENYRHHPRLKAEMAV